MLFCNVFACGLSNRRKWAERRQGMDRGRKPEISERALCAEYEAVYHYALTLCRDEAEAQDITQETFLKAMNARGSFAGQSSLYTWLCAIAKNLWRNRCKKRERELPLDWDAAPAGDGVEQAAEERDLFMAVHRALHALDEPYREVFSLRACGELSFGEIAVLFGKTEGWARVTYHRARKTILETLRKDGRI